MRAAMGQKTRYFPGFWAVLFAAMMLAGGGAAGVIRSDVAPILTFLSAVRNGDVQTVREELSRGANPNALDDNGRTALINSVVAGNRDMVALLLDSGATVDYRDELGNTALIWAAEQGEHDIS